MPSRGPRGRPRARRAHILALAAWAAVAVAAAAPASAGAGIEYGPAPPHAHAAGMPGDASGAELYVPQRVAPESWYYGMVRHEGPRGTGGAGTGGNGTTILLAADPSAILVAPSVEMPLGADHAIFAFKALELGTHAIRASVGGEFVEGSVAVLDPAGGGRGLAITLPPSTRTHHVAGAVHLVEWAAGGHHATAVPAASGLEVRLSGSGAGLLVPDTVVIPAGSTGATFDAFVAAPGTVHAHGGGMRAEAHIGFERQEPPAVRVRAWPPVLPENSAGHYIAWLEGPDGAPAAAAAAAGSPNTPPYALVHTSDPGIARVDGAPSPRHAGADRPARVQVDAWPWLGTFRTGAAGVASLTVAVPGHGSATDWFAVGPAAYGVRGAVGENGTVLGGGRAGAPAGARDGGTGGARGGGEDAPNLVVFDVVPPAAAATAASTGADGAHGGGIGRSFIAAAAYRAYADRTAEVVGGAGRAGPGEGEGSGGAGRLEVSGTVSVLRPAPGVPVEIVVSSNGAEHAATAVIGAPAHAQGGHGHAAFPSNSAVVPVWAPPGSYEVSVTAPGMRQHPRTAPLEVSAGGGSGAEPRLHILPLPVAPGRVQDIALLYAGDAAGAVLDPALALGGRARGAPAGPPVAMLEAGGGAAVSSGFVAMDSPVVRVRGTPGPGGTGTLEAWTPGTAGVPHGASPAAEPAAGRIGSWAGIGAPEGLGGDGPIVDAPLAVRAHEVFPASSDPLAAGPYGEGAGIDASGGCRPAGAAEAAEALSASGGGIPEGAGEDAGLVASRLFVCGGAGRLSIFSMHGHGSAEVRPYARTESPSIEAGFGGVVRAGEEYRIDVSMPPAPPAAPPGTVAVDTAIPHEIAGGGRAVVLRPDQAGLFSVTVAADAPGSTAASARFDVAVDASVTYAVEARDGTGAHLAVPVALSTASDAAPRTATTPHRETAEQQSVTVEFPRTARHGDRAYELVDARVLGAGGGEGAQHARGGAGAGQVPSAVTAEPGDGDVFSATYARTVLVEAAGGAVGGGAVRAGEAAFVRAPEEHVASFLVRSVWDGWDVRPAGGQGVEAGPGRAEAAAALAAGLNAQGAEASFAAADDVVVTARYREDHTGAAAVFAAFGMLAVLAVFRGAAGYRLRAAQALDAAEAACRGAWGAVRGLVPIGKGPGGERGGGHGIEEDDPGLDGGPHRDYSGAGGAGAEAGAWDSAEGSAEGAGAEAGAWDSAEVVAGGVGPGLDGGGGGSANRITACPAGESALPGLGGGGGGNADTGDAALHNGADAAADRERGSRPRRGAGRAAGGGGTAEFGTREDAPAGARAAGGDAPRGAAGGGGRGAAGAAPRPTASRPSAGAPPPPPPALPPAAGAGTLAAGDRAAAEGLKIQDDADEAAAGAAAEAALDAIRSAAAAEMEAASPSASPSRSPSAPAAAGARGGRDARQRQDKPGPARRDRNVSRASGAGRGKGKA